jgi:hypothetical protein
MPIHDWSGKPVGLFHHFHQQWAASICNALNGGCLPKGFYALLELHTAGLVPGVVTLEREPKSKERPDPSGGIAVAEAPPKTRFMSQATDEDIYAAKADRVAIYNALGDIVAVIELVSPGGFTRSSGTRSGRSRSSFRPTSRSHWWPIPPGCPRKRTSSRLASATVSQTCPFFWILAPTFTRH